MRITLTTLPRYVAVAGAALAAGVLLFAHHVVPTVDVIELSHLRFSARVNDEHAPRVPLPHTWRESCSGCETAWYRTELWLGDRPQQTWALYIPALSMNAAVYMNGRLLGQGGRFTNPTARLHQSPFYVEIPTDVWQAEQNALHILLKADPPGTGSLSIAYAGPETALLPHMEFRSALRGSLRIVSLSILIVGLAFGIVWLNRRGDRLHGWFALACIAWSVSLADSFVRNIPVGSASWVGVHHVATGIMAWALLEFAAHGLTDRVRRLVRFGWLLPASALVLLATGGPFSSAPWNVWMLASHAAIVAAGMTIIAASWRANRTRDAWRIAGAALLVLLAGADAVGFFVQSVPLQQSVLGFAAPLVVGASAWSLIVEFVESLRLVERRNAALDLAVRAKTSELERQFERIRLLEQERVLIAERERLMREMHDGLGGQLVSALAMAERGSREPAVLAETLRRALDDMRLMIDSLEPVDENLNVVLAILRERIEPRLNASGLALRWKVDDLPPMPGLGPARTLHILRVLQEAVTNVLKHASAATITIAAGVAAADDGTQEVCIEVLDDGAGFDVRSTGSGRGLRNLRHRANSIGAEVSVTSARDRGTCVRLRLPIVEAAVVAPSV